MGNEQPLTRYKRLGLSLTIHPDHIEIERRHFVTKQRRTILFRDIAMIEASSGRITIGTTDGQKHTLAIGKQAESACNAIDDRLCVYLLSRLAEIAPVTIVVVADKPKDRGQWAVDIPLAITIIGGTAIGCLLFYRVANLRLGSESTPTRPAMSDAVTISARDERGDLVPGGVVYVWNDYQTRSEIVAKCRDGEIVTLLRQSGDGVLVETADGTRGWVGYWFIKEFKPREEDVADFSGTGTKARYLALE